MIDNAGFNPARQFVRALWDYRNLWLIPMAACTILAVMFALFGPKTYSARQTLVIRDDLQGSAFKAGRFESLESLKSAQETVLEIARRPHVVRRTLEKLGPASGSKSKSWPSDQVIEETQGKININAPNGAELGETEAIVLSVTANSKQRASKFIEVLLDEIEKNSREFRVHRFKSMAEELQQSATVAKRSYEESAGQLQTFERQFSTDLGTLRSLNDSLSSKNALVDALAEMKREAREAQKQVSRVDKQMDVLRQAQSDPTILVSAPPQELLELQPALAGLTKGLNESLLRLSRNLGRYSKVHPQVISDEREIADIKKQIVGELETSFRSLDSQYSLRVQNSEKLKTRIQDYENRLSNLSGNRVGYHKLTEEVKKKQEMLGKAESMLSEIQSLGASAHTVNLLTRIDKPQISYNPIGPTKKTIVFGGMLAGLLMGIGLVMFFAPIDIGEALPSQVGRHREMATAPGVTTANGLATAPTVTTPTDVPPAVSNPATPFAAAAASNAPATQVSGQTTNPANATFMTPQAPVAAGTIATEPAADQFARALAKSIADIATNAQAEQASRISPAEAYSAASSQVAAPMQSTESAATEVSENNDLTSNYFEPNSSGMSFEPATLDTESPELTSTSNLISTPTQTTTEFDTTPTFEKTAPVDETLAAPQTASEANSIEESTSTAESSMPTSSVFDKLINQLDSAKPSNAKTNAADEVTAEIAEQTDSQSKTADIDGSAFETDAFETDAFDAPAAVPATPLVQERPTTDESISMDSILPDPFVPEPAQSQQSDLNKNAFEAAFDSVSSEPGFSDAADETQKPKSTPTEGILNGPPAELRNQVPMDEIRKLTKSTAEPVSDQLLEQNLESLLGGGLAADTQDHTDVVLPNEQNIISGLGLDSESATSDLERTLEELKNRREAPLTESRIVTPTDSFLPRPDTGDLNKEATSKEDVASPEPINRREPAETVAPPSIRQTAKTVMAGDENEANDAEANETQPKKRQKKRQKAKTVDLRDLKNQLSNANRGTDNKELGRNVAETVLAFETEEADEPAEDLSEKISRLTQSIEDYVQPDD